MRERVSSQSTLECYWLQWPAAECNAQGTEASAQLPLPPGEEGMGR